jgi:hypothetical protein
MRLLRVFGTVVIISTGSSGCFGAYQVSADNPLGAGSLRATQEDKDAGLVGIAPGFKLRDYPIIAVERFPVAKAEIADERDQRFAERMARFYQSELVRRFQETGLFSQVVNLSETDLPVGAGKALRLRGDITQLGRGSQAVRYLVGFGAGSTRAQTEMRFLDVESGQVVMVTADRRRGSMGFLGGDSEAFLRDSLNTMARDLAKFLVRLAEGSAGVTSATTSLAPAAVAPSDPARLPGPAGEPSARPLAAPGALNWPPVGASYVQSVRTSGSFGSGVETRRVRYLGEQTWQGTKVRAFSDGAVTTYVDGRRRMLARVNSSSGTPIESYEPYFVFANWPLRIGKWWPNRYRYSDHEWGRIANDARYDGEVEAYEDVRTPAGTFKSFRIGLGGGSGKTVLWYSGELGLVIRTLTERFSNHYRGPGVSETELISYDFKP